jgi:hypothetical protein
MSRIWSSRRRKGYRTSRICCRLSMQERLHDEQDRLHDEQYTLHDELDWL